MLKNKKLWSPILVGLIFALVLVIDLVSKELIIKYLIPNVGDSVEVVPGFINFVYVENKGGPWGVFSNSTLLLAIMSIVILILILVFYILRIRQTKEKSSIWLATGVGLIAGGCVGNLVDRLVFGFVRDFINFQFMDFPVFNFADVGICAGVVVLVVYFLFFYSKEDKNKKNNVKNEKNNKLEGEND